MLNELATVAAYSASANFGRDVYKAIKKGGPVVAFLAGAFLTVIGIRHLVMGHPHRGFLSTLFITVLGSLLMIIAGTALVTVAVVAVGGYTGLINDTRGPLAGQIIRVVLLYLAAAIPVGLIWGLMSRASRHREQQVEANNLQFLEENGFTDLGLGEDIIEDGEGNRLKLRSEEDGQLVFSVVGRRNVRAAIQLDDAGRMVAYTGAVRL